jgi:hypothetical protein
VIPLLICHGKKPWPEEEAKFSSLFSGPVEELSGYIPDFSFDLHDLTRYKDEEIKGNEITRVVFLLLKHGGPDLLKWLPSILRLLQDLKDKDRR